MRDTQPAAESIRLTAIRRMPPAARIRQAFDVSEWARSLAIVGLRQHHPGRTDVELVEILLRAHLIPATNRPAR